MPVPYTFANQSGAIPLSELDANFATIPAYASTAGNVVNNTQPNITSLGNLVGLSVTGITTLGFVSASGNIIAGNINITGNISTANYIFGNGSYLTGMYANTNVAAYLPTYSGNLNSVGNITASGKISGVTISASGNVYGANIVGTYLRGCGANITGISIGNSILNGTSNISIPNACGPIEFNVNSGIAGIITCSQLAIGLAAGSCNQGSGAVAIGVNSGTNTQGIGAVAIGGGAAIGFQGSGAIAIGAGSGSGFQGICAIAIGNIAATICQRSDAIAIGTGAGQFCQGANSIAIGKLAGACIQAGNTIILNATGSAVNGVAAQTNSFYVAPIRSICAAGNASLYYCTSTKEVTSGPIILPVYANAAVRDSTITSPAAGMLIFNTAAANFQGYNGTSWGNITLT